MTHYSWGCYASGENPLGSERLQPGGRSFNSTALHDLEQAVQIWSTLEKSDLNPEASLVAQMVKNLLAIWEIWVRSLGWEDSPGGGCGKSLSWRISWTEEPGGLQSMGSQRVGYDWVTKHTTEANWSIIIKSPNLIAVQSKKSSSLKSVLNFSPITGNSVRANDLNIQRVIYKKE